MAGISSVWGAFLYAQDIPAAVRAGAAGSFSHEFFYSYEDRDLDFDARGLVNSRQHSGGVAASYALNEQIRLALSGGVILDPELRNATSAWRGRSGYFYGLDLIDQVFPATAYWPGIFVQAGVSSRTAYYDRQETSGVESTIDQKSRDLRYGGAVIAAWKLAGVTPYFGPRVDGADVRWTDNAPASGSPDHIEGHPDHNVGVLVGCSFPLRQEWQVQIEGRFFNETAVLATVQWLKI